MKRLVVFTLLFLICTCSLQAQYFSTRSRVVEDMPPLGSRIDLSHRLIRDKHVHSVWLFNQPIGNDNYDLARDYRLDSRTGFYNDPVFLVGAASPNDPEWYGSVGWKFRSTGGGTWATTTNPRIIKARWTISMWIMITADVTGYILYGMNADNSLQILWNTSNSYKGFYALQGASIGGPTYAAAKRIHDINKVHHVVATATYEELTRLYVDNEIQTNGLAKAGATHTTFRIGSTRTGTLPANFVIYALYIWNERLTATDIEELYLDPFCIIEKPVDGIGVWAAITDAIASQVIIVR